MRRILFCLIATTIFQISLAARVDFTPPYQISQSIQSPRASLITYRSERAALLAIADSSANYVLLDGEWRIKYFGDPAVVTPRDLLPGPNLERWGSEVDLPSSWQMKGFGGAALFSAELYPFLDAKPRDLGGAILAKQCVLYARHITVPFDFTDRKLYLNVGASSGRLTVYVNGKEVGFSTDSKNPAEFDISAFVERGQNCLVLKVDRFSQADWIENSAGWRLNGVNRSIYMLAQPKIRIKDVIVNTSLDPTYSNGLLETSLLLRTELLNTHQVTVYYDLYDPSGEIVNKSSRQITLSMRDQDTVRFTASVRGVAKWTAETPALYTIVYRVKREGRFTEYVAVKVGFRQVDIRGNQLLINGVPPVIKGVNFEEFSPATGNVLNESEVRRELLSMRKLGVNAVRTGGYPLASFFYNLTDSIGFYVINVANVDSRGSGNTLARGHSLANNPVWRDVFVDRAITAYERTKRSASVIAVALGESAGNGYCMYQAYLAIKARSAKTVVVYDGADAQWNTDIAMPLYPSIELLDKMVNQYKVEQPIIASKVRFDERYWATRGVQGAFIDRWVPQAITATDIKFETLSGDYKLSRLTNGVIEQSSAQNSLPQIGSLFANVGVEVVDAKRGICRFTNRMTHSDLSQFTVRYRTISPSGVSRWSVVGVECAAGQTVEVVLGSFGGQRHIEVEVGDLFNTILR